jgi:uncharacterized OB-fold protein
VSGPLEIQVCEACGRALFPVRALCPGCGSGSFRLEAAGRGVVEEVTARVREDGSTVDIGSVRLARGPVVIARLPEPTLPGAEVVLWTDDGAPVARLPTA